MNEAEEAIQALEQRWEKRYPKLVEKRGEKSEALLQLLFHPKPIRSYFYTTNQLEQLMKKVKRRTKVVKVFGESAAVEELLYLVLGGLNERLLARRLKEFAKIGMKNYHVALTH